MMEFNLVRICVAACSAIGFVALAAGSTTPVESLSMQPQPMRGTVSASAASPHQIFAPSVLRDAAVFPGQQESEPNDDWGDADGPLRFGITYTAYIEGVPYNDDFFYIDVPSAGAFEVAATGLPQYCLLLVYDEDLNSIGVAYLAPYRVQITAAAAGRYYVRVRVSDIITSTEPYELRVEWQVTPISTPTPTTMPTPSIAPTKNAVGEDDDTPCLANHALTDTEYTSYGDDEYDFFELNVSMTSTLYMTLSADVLAQIELRSPLTDTDCSAESSTRVLAQSSIKNFLAVIDRSVLPGKYYARVYIPSNNLPFDARPYTFLWNLTAGSKPAKVCIGQDASIDDCAGDVRDNKLNIKWQGLNGNARIHIEFRGNSGGGGSGPNKCLPGSREPVGFTTGDVDGARNVDEIPTGGYAVRIIVTDAATGDELYRNEQSVKVGCQFYRPAAAQATPEFAP